jgi:hypothetical protein
MKIKSLKQYLFGLGIVGFLAFGLILGALPADALADTNCRNVARDTQNEYSIGFDKGVNTREELNALIEQTFTKSLIDYPECRAEIQTVLNWNKAADSSAPFPFPKSDDPKSYPLGPVSWWWDTIYNGLFNGNTALMFLFGWELFLMPFPLVLGVVFLIVTTPLNIVRAVLARRNKK